MKIHCLFIQRKCAYEGQYAPELYDAVDEFTNDENPGYLVEAKSRAMEDSDIELCKELVIRIDDNQFKRAFNPAPELQASLHFVPEKKS